MSSYDETAKSLVSAKLQGVALRTPPPADSYVVDCFVIPVVADSESSGARRVLLRLPSQATALDLLVQLGFIQFEVLQVGARGVLSTDEGGVRTQLFSIRPATGDGMPFMHLQEADLTSSTPVRDALRLRFPFSIAVVPIVPPATTERWTIEHWKAALSERHRKRVDDANAQYQAASSAPPDTKPDVFRASAMVHPLMHHPLERPAPLDPFAMVTTTDTETASALVAPHSNIIVTPATQGLDTAASLLALPPSNQLLLQPNSTEHSTASAYMKPSTSPSVTPRTPGRRRASSVTVSDIGDIAQLSASPGAALGTSRKERRAAAEADRQRKIELQKLREQKIAQIEAQRNKKSASTVVHVQEREAERSSVVAEERKLDAIRQAKIDSRYKLELDSKQTIAELRASHFLTKKLDMERAISQTYQTLFPASSSSAQEESQLERSNSGPFVTPLASPQNHVAEQPFAVGRSRAASHFDGGHSEETKTKSSRQNSVRHRSQSVVDLPDAEETELSLFEKEQAKTNFVNRVAAARKATDRRMSKFAMVKFHPFVVHAELKALLEKLDADAHAFVHGVEEQQEVERKAEQECSTADYHRGVMESNVARRVQIKMERKFAAVEHHVKEITFEKVKKETSEAERKQREEEAQARIAEFYQKKRLQEEEARKMAQREKELAAYIERQKVALRSLESSRAQ